MGQPRSGSLLLGGCLTFLGWLVLKSHAVLVRFMLFGWADRVKERCTQPFIPSSADALLGSSVRAAERRKMVVEALGASRSEVLREREARAVNMWLCVLQDPGGSVKPQFLGDLVAKLLAPSRPASVLPSPHSSPSQ